MASEPIYMNELSDDRSSGYRSSPSLTGSQPSTPDNGDLFGSREDVFNLNLKSLNNKLNLQDKVLQSF